jgi:hypothetical protein
MNKNLGNLEFYETYYYANILTSIFQGHFNEIPRSDLGQRLKKPGVLKRVGISMWVKRAVFYRDRGMCSLCQKDLSGTLSAQPDSQYDPSYGGWDE